MCSIIGWIAFQTGGILLNHKRSQRFCLLYKVVNDAVERGVKLHSDYAAVLTDNAKQRKTLLQAFENESSWLS